MQLPKFIGLTKESEEQLAASFMLVANKHEKNSEVRDMCKQLARWSRSNLEALAPVIDKFGAQAADGPHRLRSALFHGDRQPQQRPPSGSTGSPLGGRRVG